MKLKVGVAGQNDPERLRNIRKIVGKRMDLRIDANEAWTPQSVVDNVRALLPFKPSVLEQPIKHGQVDTLAELRPRIGIPVMLDESLCGYPDAERPIDRRTSQACSTSGSRSVPRPGVASLLDRSGLAQRSGLRVQLGCHPGETALLSAAGRHVASHVAGISYVEGSYDRHILAENLTRDNLTFGGCSRPGHGLDRGDGEDLSVQRRSSPRLERMTIRRAEIRYD